MARSKSTVSNSTERRALDLVREAGVLRPRDLEEHGIARQYLRRLRDKGLLERPSRGLYTLPEAEVTEHHSLAEASKRVPNGIICLLSALRFHELTTQLPAEVWLALPPGAWTPKADHHPRLRVVRFSGQALTTGVEERVIDGVPVRIYGPAKTVADCFKCRNRIGVDVAIEALRDCLAQRRCSIDELWRYAKICRVASVMRPYLEMIA